MPVEFSKAGVEPSKRQLTLFQKGAAVAAGVAAALIGANKVAEQFFTGAAEDSQRGSDALRKLEITPPQPEEGQLFPTRIPENSKVEPNGGQEAERIYTFSDGSKYDGDLVDGKQHGEGTLILPDGHKYEGDWVNGRPHGKGIYVWPDHSIYAGDWVDGKQHGEGTLILPDGSKYDGDWVDGKQHGEGTLILPNGSEYQGSWVNGKREGQGTYSWSSGGKYEGDFVDGKQHGQGTLYQADGSKFEGSWVNGKQHGQGTFYQPDGSKFECSWVNGHPIGSIANLGDIEFLGLLTGKMSDSTLGYNLGIIADFLRQQNDPAYHELQSALTVLVEPKSDTVSDVLKKIHSDQAAQLLAYGYSKHAMGLRIHPAEDGNYYFDIFNSGNGLQYHPAIILKPEGEELFQTMLSVKVPREKLTEELLSKLLDFDKFKNVKESYRAILGIPGAQRIIPNGMGAVWQRKQKSGNCALEWIFAVLRNTMGLRSYTRFRRKLYQAALDAPSNALTETPDSELMIQSERGPQAEPDKVSLEEARVRIRRELERKLHKSLDLSVVSPNDRTTSFLARQNGITRAQELISSKDDRMISLGLDIFARLPEGEGIAEITNAASQLLNYPNSEIRARARRLLEQRRSHIERDMRE